MKQDVRLTESMEVIGEVTKILYMNKEFIDAMQKAAYQAKKAQRRAMRLLIPFIIICALALFGLGMFVGYIMKSCR